MTGWFSHWSGRLACCISACLPGDSAGHDGVPATQAVPAERQPCTLTRLLAYPSFLAGAPHPCQWAPAIKVGVADRVRRDRRERPRRGGCELAPDHMDPGSGGGLTRRRSTSPPRDPSRQPGTGRPAGAGGQMSAGWRCGHRSGQGATVWAVILGRHVSRRLGELPAVAGQVFDGAFPLAVLPVGWWLEYPGPVGSGPLVPGP